MAPIGEAYFPPLDRCLSGKRQLLSWETVYTNLSQLGTESRDGILRDFLTDPQVTNLLANSSTPHSSPNPNAKSSFQTKTSAINAPSSPSLRYDINEIKEDALWLSNTADVDEIAALRVAVLQWQTKPAEDLRVVPPAESTMNALQSVLAGARASTSTNPSWSDKNGAAPLNDKQFRRSELLKVLLSEDRFLLKTSEYILAGILCDTKDESARTDVQNQKSHRDWLRMVGETLLSAWKIDKPGKDKRREKGFLPTAVDALRARTERLGKPCPWLGDEDISEEIGSMWGQNQVVEMIHLLQIVVTLLQAPRALVEAENVILWFRFMNEVSFFEVLRESLENIQAPYQLLLQSLSVLISLTLLDVSSTIELLTEVSTSGALSRDNADGSPYALMPPIMNELNDIFINLAFLKVSSPVTLTWSIITQTTRELASAAREAKETRQSLRAADKYGAADSSDTDGGDRAFPKIHSSLRRRSSGGSDTSLQMTLVEEVHDAISITEIDGDSINYLALSAVQNDNVFEVLTTIATEYCTPFGFEHGAAMGGEMRKILLDLVGACVDFVQYTPALISATMAVLTGSERFWDLLDSPLGSFEHQPTSSFIRNPLLRYKILLRAASRFPYESLPFLQISRALGFQYTNSKGEAAPPWMNLEELDIFTCKIPNGFDSLTPIREEEDGDYIKLTDNLSVVIGSRETDLLAPWDTSRAYMHGLSAVIIPSNTTGIIQSEAKPFIIGWNYSYQGLGYMGKILQSALAADGSPSASSSIISSAVVSEVIHLINTLLTSAIKDPTAGSNHSKILESAKSILGHASDGLGQNQDIISVILQLFENELYGVQQLRPDEISMELLTQCTQFMCVLLRLLPDRIWPFLGRSGLIGIGQDEPQFSYVISQEMMLGRYDFLLACVRLYAALVEDAIALSISRKAPAKALVRFGSSDASASGISRDTMQNVLLYLCRCMIDVLESISNWKFVVAADRMEINAHLCATLEKVLYHCFGIDDRRDTSQKLTGALAPSAEYIVNSFLSASENDFIVTPLLNIFSMATQVHRTTLPTNKDRFLSEQTIAALRLATILISVNSYLAKPASQLEKELFKSASILIRLYANFQSLRVPTIGLFDALLRSAGKADGQPPSLLGQLGQKESNCFLEMLSQLDQPLPSNDLSVAIWKLLSTIVSQRQQWFAMYVLTGKTPRESHKDKKGRAPGPEMTREPILMVALENLSAIDALESKKALVMLDFIAVSADFWPWVFTTLDSHPQFLKAISEYAARGSSAGASTHDRTRDGTPDYISVQIFSRIAKILAMYTRYTQQVNNQKFARGLVPHLNYLIKKAITAPSYNNSLHSNLRHNFEGKHPNCNLTDLKKSALQRPSIGDSFYYDMAFSSKVLAYDPAWLGRRGQGFAEEFRRANTNLSLVEAEIELFNGWKSLLVELSGPLAMETKFQKIMALAVVDCLKTNANNSLPQSIFERLSSSRADLAFTLLQRLVEVKSKEAEATSIMDVAWSHVLSHSTNLEAALTGDEADYYRMILRILYLSLQLHVNSDPKDVDPGIDPRSRTNVLRTVYEILSKGVAQGFRTLTMLVHTSPALVRPSDFGLIIATLSSCLQVPGLEGDSSRLLEVFSDAQTTYCATTLLSWSDRLAASTSNDPILGELSVEFLVELSSETSLAESLAVDGVISQILSTNVVRILQLRAFSPTDLPRRMFNIWARGLLPLMLNLLNAIGPPIAAEITSALNLFPHQLEQASNAFAPHSRMTRASQGYVTLSMAVEVHNLALIVSILKTFREAGASAAVVANDIADVKWEATQVAEDVEGWLQDREALRGKILATDRKEEVWMSTKPLRNDSPSVNILEEKIVRELGGVVGVLVGSGED